MKRVALRLPVFAALVVLGGCRSELMVELEVLGKGTVTLGETTCADGCIARVSGPAVAAQMAEAGSRFVSWSGLCSGAGPCTISRSGKLGALFVEPGKLAIDIVGPGVVSLSSGDTCSAPRCEFSVEAPVTLTPRSSTGSTFVGFAGSCSGTGACVLKEGSVSATFAPAKQPLHIVFEGDGSGEVVEPGGLRCTATCTLQVEASKRYQFSAVPATGSVAAGFSGDCAGATCTVEAPATARVRFDMGRRVEVTFEGAGAGSVAINGETCAGSCVKLLSPNVDLAFSAVPATTSRVVGFSGDCVGAAGCSLAPGVGGIKVRVRFEKVLQWVRSFPVTEQFIVRGVLIDEAGIVVSGSGSVIDIDGTSYGGGTAVIPSLAWDAGVESVLDLYDRTDSGSIASSATMTTLLRGDAGELYGFGSCAGVSFYDLPCGPSNGSYPAAFRAAPDGGVTAFVEASLDGFSYESAANLGSTIYALVGVRTPKQVQIFDNKLQRLASSYVPFTVAYSKLTPRPNGKLQIIQQVSSSLSWLGCQIAQPIGMWDTALLEIDAALTQCSVLEIIHGLGSAAGVRVDAIAEAPGRSTVFAGIGEGQLSFTPLVTPVPFPYSAFKFVAYRSDGQFMRVDTDPAPRLSADPSPRDAWWSSRGLEVAGETVSGGLYFGNPNPDNRAFIASYDEDGGISSYRRITEAVVSPYGSGLRGGHVNGLTALVMTGRSLSFEGEPLAPDSQQRLHVIVLRE